MWGFPGRSNEKCGYQGSEQACQSAEWFKSIQTWKAGAGIEGWNQNEVLKNPEGSPLWDTKFQAEVLKLQGYNVWDAAYLQGTLPPEASERQLCEPRARVFQK